MQMKEEGVGPGAKKEHATKAFATGILQAKRFFYPRRRRDTHNTSRSLQVISNDVECLEQGSVVCCLHGPMQWRNEIVPPDTGRPE